MSARVKAAVGLYGRIVMLLQAVCNGSFTARRLVVCNLEIGIDVLASRLRDENEEAEVAPTCLVVDDEPAILRLVVLVLRDLGYETLSAPDAETAAGILAFRRPDLIITDIRLPGADGLELARQVKETPPLKSTPILLISAYGEPRSHPADGFLPKPFDIDGLTEFVAPYSGRGSDQARDEPRQTKTPGRSSR